MKKLFGLVVLVLVVFSSCQKEEDNNIEPTPETWKFTKMVNAVCGNNGSLLSIDFYQKKGTQWRIVRMQPDDFVTFYLKDTITPNSYELPIDNENAFMTSNAKLFNPTNNQMYKASGLVWFEGEPIEFNSYIPFNDEFTELPATWNTIDKISAATYSLEQAYDNNNKVTTYIFYDFPNETYLYYAKKTSADFIIGGYTLPELCPTCTAINWEDMDAVTCTKGNDSGETYYFFDFDAKKMYLLERYGKDTNNPSFNFDTGLVINFDQAFHNNDNGAVGSAFDFSK